MKVTLLMALTADGKIGKDALALWNKYDHERPDYETYVKRIKKRERPRSYNSFRH